MPRLLLPLPGSRAVGILAGLLGLVLLVVGCLLLYRLILAACCLIDDPDDGFEE